MKPSLLFKFNPLTECTTKKMRIYTYTTCVHYITFYTTRRKNFLTSVYSRIYQQYYVAKKSLPFNALVDIYYIHSSVYKYNKSTASVLSENMSQKYLFFLYFR